jgi:hypothetical protein
MVDRLRGQVRDVKADLNTANVRLVTIGRACVFLMDKLNDLSAQLEQTRYHVLDSDTSAASPEKKRRLNQPKSIDDVHDSKFNSGSLVLPGLFNGDWEGERCDGDKRSAVFFRVLCRNIYPGKDDLLEEFLKARCDVKEAAVKKWFNINEDGLVLRLRSRRSALSRYIKSNVIQALGGTEMPPEKGDTMVTAEWIQEGRDLWANAKLEARASGLIYPACITALVLRQAKQADPHTPYSVICPPPDSEDLWWQYLIGMEAYFINVVAAVFGSNTQDYVIQLKKDTLCGDIHNYAMQLVLNQRAFVAGQLSEE